MEKEKTKFTPGPWTAHETRPGFKIELAGAPAYVTAGAKGDPGNRVVACVTSVDGAYSEANANLIAAAPDILLALQRLLAEAEHCMERDKVMMDHGLELTMARDAIAKAKGGGK